MSREVKASYVGVALSAEHYPAEDSSKAPRIGVAIRIIEGTDRDGNDATGKTVFKYMSLHEKAQEITARELRVMGWQDNDIVALTGLGSTKFRVTETDDTYFTPPRPAYSVWEIDRDRPQLQADVAKAMTAQFKALAAKVAPLKLTDANKAPTELPLAKTGESNGAGEKPKGLPF